MFSPAPRSLTDYAAQVEAIAEQLASMVKAAGKVVMLSRFVVLPVSLTLNASPFQASTARSVTSSRPGLRSTALGVRVQQRSAWAATVAVLTGRCEQTSAG